MNKIIQIVIFGKLFLRLNDFNFKRKVLDKLCLKCYFKQNWSIEKHGSQILY
jgi:hypothetical protein